MGRARWDLEVGLEFDLGSAEWLEAAKKFIEEERNRLGTVRVPGAVGGEREVPVSDSVRGERGDSETIRGNRGGAGSGFVIPEEGRAIKTTMPPSCPSEK